MRTGRKILILAEGAFGVLTSKTAACVIRYMPDQVVAVLDSRHAGKAAHEVIGIGEGIPILASIEEAIPLSPTELLIGIAPRGGGLPEEWRETLRKAISHGMDITSGLHTYLGDDPELAALASEGGARIRDIRRPPDPIPVGLGRVRDVVATVILTVGTDCNVGKMTVAYELWLAAQRSGIRAAFVATGQTGIFIAGEGIVVDSVKADFIAGAVETMVLRAATANDLVLVEGQGSLLHPGYSGVTLGLIHGSMPDGFILCHQPTRIPDYGVRLPGLGRWIEIYERSVADIKPAPVLGIALNCFDLGSKETEGAIRRAREETGLPATDPIRYGVDPLLEAIGKVVKDR